MDAPQPKRPQQYLEREPQSVVAAAFRVAMPCHRVTFGFECQDNPLGYGHCEPISIIPARFTGIALTHRVAEAIAHQPCRGVFPVSQFVKFAIVACVLGFVAFLLCLAVGASTFSSPAPNIVDEEWAVHE